MRRPNGSTRYLPGVCRQLAFEHLNLRWNPFGEPSRQERIELAVVEPAVPRSDRVVQYVGEAGHGKTTRLLAALGNHPEAIYYRVPEGSSRLPFRLERGRAYLIDEAQRLTRVGLRRLLSGRFAVVVGSHADLTRHARVPVETRVVSTEPSQLAAIFRRRVEWARRAPGPVPGISLDTLACVRREFGDDVRGMEAKLYDAFQHLDGIRDV